MRDLLMQIAISLIIATAIGFILGWLFKHLFCKRKLAQIEELWSSKYRTLESAAGGLRGQISDRDATISTLKAAPAPAPARDGDGDGGGADADHLRAELKKAEARIVEMDKDLDRCEAALAAKTSQPEAPAAPPATTTAPSGDKPAWLMSSPSDGEPDDLKKIWGVGPVLEKTMNTLGIYYYRQVANLTESDIQWVADNINAFPDRIKRDRWTEQATDLHKDKYGSEP